MTTISQLPCDVHVLFLKKLDINDLVSCLHVCKEWNRCCGLDSTWDSLALKHHVTAKEHKYKAIRSKEKDLRKKCSKEFLMAFSIIFGKSSFLLNLPLVKLETKDMISEYRWVKGTGDTITNKYFPEKYFGNPMVIAVVKDFLSKTEPSYLLCSVPDVKSKKVCRIALSFGINSKKELFIDLYNNSIEIKDFFEKSAGFSQLSSAGKFEFLRNISEGKHQLKIS